MTQPNNVQFSIEAEETFDADKFGPSAILPVIIKSETTYVSFAPQHAECTEIVSATYGARGRPDVTLHETLTDGADIILTQAFMGKANCFPHAPDIAKGIPGPALSRIENLGWPQVIPGLPFSVAFAIERSILSRARGTCQHCGEPSGRLPAGYNPIPKSIKVQVRLTLSGPVVRN